MDVVEYILDGLEKALELERELGVRSVELDRGLLADDSARQRVGGVVPNAPQPRENENSFDDGCGAQRTPRIAPRFASDLSVGGYSRPTTVQHPVNQTIKQPNSQTISDLVFLHDRPLSPKGVEMMAKILTALGKPDAPIVVTPPVPQAKVTVVLGGLALKKYFTGMRGEPGQWQKTPEGRDVLITYSPEYILRFGTVTPAVQKIKQDMWLSLKAVKQRLVV